MSHDARLALLSPSFSAVWGSQVARDDVNTLVVTNDLMRDHRNFFPGTREFVRWKRSHLVSFSFRWEKDG